jgi:hypothetical protein
MKNNDFKKICAEIEDEIENTCIDPDDKASPIIDGIVNIDRYTDTTPKILWILKEPYDDEENGVATGGGWHFSKDFLTKDDFYTRMGRSRATWHPVIYVSYGIINSLTTWDEMSDIRDDLSMLKVIEQIAVINVKKLPGFTRTKGFGPIERAYQANKTLLHKQIKIYDPDIIIGGSTMHLFYEELGIKKEEIEVCGSIHVSVKQNKLYIAAYHPGQTQVDRYTYVDDILKVAQDFPGSRTNSK